MARPEGTGRLTRLRAFIGAHRGLAWAAAVTVVTLVVFVLVWFQPQKLLIEKEVDEALPGAGVVEGDENDGAQDENDDPAPAAEPSIETLASGPFRGLEHSTSGRASLVKTDDGRTYLRFEDLETSNGPDLRVYLSEIEASDDWYAYGERFVDLGALKGNLGNQNYEVPDNVDLDRFRSAVIWCRRFTVGFGVAPLNEA